MIPLHLDGRTANRGRTQKYRNERQAGFDSKHERAVFGDLLWEQRFPRKGTRQIASIERQVSYELVPAQRSEGKVVERAVRYIADFRVRYDDGTVDVIDAKSSITRKQATYVIKRKLMLQVHGIRVTER